jgi:hypothetical protein
LNITIETKQLKDLSKKLENAGAKTIKMSELELEASANDVLSIAKVLAPVDNGGLRGAMAMKAVTKNKYRIGNNKDYAPYVEFGTGAVADIPPEWADFASQFRGSTGQSWDNGLEEIRQWCIRKGIPESAAYPIFMSILESGVIATPFLYPAYKEGQKLLIKRIINVIKDFKLK